MCTLYATVSSVVLDVGEVAGGVRNLQIEVAVSSSECRLAIVLYEILRHLLPIFIA